MLKITLKQACLVLLAVSSAVSASVTLAKTQTTAPKTLPLIDYRQIHHPVMGRKGMVVSQNHYASEIGAQILREGGNAIDAAVAVGFGLAVSLPRAGNLGGGGFMLVHLAKDNKTIAIDYREQAPKSAHRNLFLDENGEVDKNKARFSLAAAGVPGTVAGMRYALEKYGTMTWAQVIQPAENLATQGVVVSDDMAMALSRRSHLRKHPSSCRAYFKAECLPYQTGETLKQPDLANTLKLLRTQGAAAFYEGEIAQKIVQEMVRGGGLITMEDLKNYQVKERQPVVGRFNGFDIASMPPSSSGGAHLIQILNILETIKLSQYPQGSAQSLHFLAEAARRAYADRSEYMGDSDFVDVPIKGLVDKRYAEALAEGIRACCASKSSEIKAGNPPKYESPDTTHYSVMDRWGNAVSNTYTLNFSFGSGIVIPGTGILMNNEMDDFSAKPGVANAYGLVGGEANAIQAFKRPLSSMTPTIVFKEGKPYLLTGSPGGSRIITTVLQILVNTLVYDMNIAEATAQPRIHHQWLPDVLMVEPGVNTDTLALLKKMGHQIRVGRTMGSVQSILYSEGVFHGAADTRRPGALAVAP